MLSNKICIAFDGVESNLEYYVNGRLSKGSRLIAELDIIDYAAVVITY